MMAENKKQKSGIKHYWQLGELWGYFLRKKNTEEKPDFTLRSMHFVNKFSILIFLMAILYLIIKHLF